MIEKVKPKHPDKLADRIADAIVDKVYQKNKKDRVAVEVLVGHGHCHIIVETTSNVINNKTVKPIVNRILGNEVELDLKVYQQDPIFRLLDGWY